MGKSSAEDSATVVGHLQAGDNLADPNGWDLIVGPLPGPGDSDGGGSGSFEPSGGSRGFPLTREG